jgi:hypothetical protein
VLHARLLLLAGVDRIAVRYYLQLLHPPSSSSLSQYAMKRCLFYERGGTARYKQTHAA